MFNTEFYPTPNSLLEKIECDFNDMWSTLPDIISVLEPSAGKGDIVDWLKRRQNTTYYGHKGTLRFSKLDIDCVEIDKELSATLKGKGLFVVHNDFLHFETMKKYDLIFMNPPFSNGDAHLLKAISMQERYGGMVVCILNAETIRNPFSNSRKDLLRLLEKYDAQVRYYSDCFCAFDAERQTAVEVAVVVLQVPVPEHFSQSFVFDKLDKGELIQKLSFSVEDNSTEIIPAGLEYLDAYIKQFNDEITAGIALLKEYNAYKTVRKLRFSAFDGKYEDDVLNLKVGAESAEEYAVNEYIRSVRYRYWNSLFANPKFTGKLTSKMVDELFSNVKEMEHYDFTMHNILMLLSQIRDSTLKGIEDSLMTLFDTFSNLHSYIGDTSANIHYYNGWKTNKAHKVNKKVIIPMYGVWDCWRYGSRTSWSLRSYQAFDRLKDLAKALDYLADPVYSSIDTHENLNQQIKINFDKGISKDIDSKYFILTFYKKGTCHIVFKDDTLLEKFNLYAGLRRAWLPPDYGKKPYKNLNAEERAVADSFSGGEEEYNRIYENQQTYLTEQSNLLMLTY